MTDKISENKPACSVKSSPFPAEVICPNCKTTVEMWSDETETTCKVCGSLVNNCNEQELSVGAIRWIALALGEAPPHPYL